DELSCLECHRASDYWMARTGVWQKELLHALHRDVHAELFLLRCSTKPWPPAVVPGFARSFRWGLAADGTGDSEGYVSSQAARPCLWGIWGHGCRWSGSRAHYWRMAFG